MVDDDRRFSGRSAIVTGASRGIGLAIAQRLAAEGARVLLTARHEDGLREALAGFPPGSAVAVAGRADDPEHIRATVDTAAREFGGLDILIPNAGINPVYGPLLDLELTSARKILEVNLLANLAWVQAVVRDPRLGFRGRRGSVVLISSIVGQNASPGLGMYGVSKAANAHLARSLAVELAPEIRVNAVTPGVITTRFARSLYEGREEQVAAGYPLGRLGVPADVAGAVAFLVSEDAGWITGQVLTIDGGLLASGGGR